MMTEDEYVAYVLSLYEVATGPSSPAIQVATMMLPALQAWAGPYLSEIGFSGSYAKGTAVHGTTDIDLFISIKANTPDSLGQVYATLFQRAKDENWSPRPQNVSVGTTVRGFSVDLVPGRIQDGYTNWHSLYKRKSNSWTQANVVAQTNLVSKSGRTREIRALKIWRMLHRLDFPSFYLELMVIDAVKGNSFYALGRNVIAALTYISDNIETARVIDPANTNNVLSDDLNAAEKRQIAVQARSSAAMPNWGQIIW